MVLPAVKLNISIRGAIVKKNDSTQPPVEKYAYVEIVMNIAV